MAKKKKNCEYGATREYLTMKNGAEYKVDCKDGKYFYCGDTRFRITNPNILSVQIRTESNDIRVSDKPRCEEAYFGGEN